MDVRVVGMVSIHVVLFLVLIFSLLSFENSQCLLIMV